MEPATGSFPFPCPVSQILKLGFSYFSMAEKVTGLEIEPSMKVMDLVKSMENCGLQATQVGRAAKIISKMKGKGTVRILTFTTNLVTSGMRELFAKLCREKKVDVIITSIGSVEEDVMKCSSSFELCSFDEDDVKLHKAGKNRVGNMIIANKNYERLEKTLMSFFEKEYSKQVKLGRLLAPNEIISDLGLELNDKDSFVYWAARNKIPVFCPAPTDGAFGLQMYFFKQRRPEFGIDVTGDLRPLGRIILDADKTAGIILGGGVAKHHAIGANLLRDGFDMAIYICTGTPYDGSLSGARVNEAKSWGKIKENADTVHVEADASIVFPMLATILLE